MAVPVVFIDTNCVDNRSSSQTFLGNRRELELIGKRAKLILPKIVYDEVLSHVTTYLSSQLDALKRNPHRHLLNIGDVEVDAISIDDIINDLTDNETIGYETLDLTDKMAAFERIYRHAVEGSPPFEPNGDKGFKDTVIALTVEEYIERNSVEYVFLLTKDSRLSEYFQNNKKVSIISDYRDFDLEYSGDKVDRHLLDRIANYLQDEKYNLSEELEPIDQWMNWDEDLIVLFAHSHQSLYVRIDTSSREPLDYYAGDINTVINELHKTSNFKYAHVNVASARDILGYIDEGQANDVYQAYIGNDQIFSIGSDDDILQSANELFYILDGFAMYQEARTLRELYELKNKTREEERAMRKSLPF